MIVIRNSSDRGITQTDWLKSFHTFSFGEYYDPNFMGFKNLRVINEDFIQPAQGFGMHPHRDMEIITYVVNGKLVHKDSMGTGSVIEPGEIQRMSAGTGVRHSEFNYSNSELLHLLQIWIIPEKQGLTPSYEQKSIQKLYNQFILIGSKETYSGAITIHQNVALYVAYLTPKTLINYNFKINHSGWLQLIKGTIILNEHTLSAGDAVAISDEQILQIKCIHDAELLLFDFT